MSLLFLGVGNAQRGDDAVGPLMAERLRESGLLASREVEILPHSGEGASLMQLWAGRSLVVIVDAMKSGQRLGTVRRFDAVTERLQGGVFRYSSHLFGLAEAIEMARQLGTLPPAMIVYGIEGRDFAFDTPPAQAVQRAAERVLRRVAADFGLTPPAERQRHA